MFSLKSLRHTLGNLVVAPLHHPLHFSPETVHKKLKTEHGMGSPGQIVPFSRMCTLQFGKENFSEESQHLS